MCGIAGLYRFGDTPIRQWQLEMLASSLEYRGNDATGFAIMRMNGTMGWYKLNDPAWRVVSGRDFKEWIANALPYNNDVRIALVHTRKATKGSPYKSANNHPMVQENDPKSGCVVHNGWINNDDSLFECNTKNGFKRSCDTDSDIIRAILDFNDGITPKTIKEMSLMDGCAAIAAIHPTTPDKLLLLRDGNPLMLGSTEDMLYFASDKRAIHRAAKPWVKRHGTLMQLHAPDIAFVPMNNKSGYIIGPNGLEYHAEFDCTGKMFRNPSGTSYAASTNWHQRQADFKAKASETQPGVTVTTTRPNVTTYSMTSRELVPVVTAPPVKVINPKYVMCPNLTCQHVIDLEGTEFENVPLDLLACKECNVNLESAQPVPSRLN
jgi:predicted glutamine amidotransferase